MLSFHVKFVQTDRRTDGRTTVKLYTPDLSMRGHKKTTRLTFHNYYFIQRFGATPSLGITSIFILFIYIYFTFITGITFFISFTNNFIFTRIDSLSKFYLHFFINIQLLPFFPSILNFENA